LQQLASIPFWYCLDCNVKNKCYENIQQAAFGKVELDVFEADELVRPTAIIGFAWIIKTHISGVATK